MTKSGLQRRLEKLELRSRAHTLAAQPDGESKRLFMEKIEAISQRLQAARDSGVYMPRIEVGEVKERLRACLEDMRRERA